MGQRARKARVSAYWLYDPELLPKLSNLSFSICKMGDNHCAGHRLEKLINLGWIPWDLRTRQCWSRPSCLFPLENEKLAVLRLLGFLRPGDNHGITDIGTLRTVSTI